MTRKQKTRCQPIARSGWTLEEQEAAIYSAQARRCQAEVDMRVRATFDPAFAAGLHFDRIEPERGN